MVKRFHRERQDSRFYLTSIGKFKEHEADNTYRIFWCTAGEVQLEVDMEQIRLQADEVLCLAPTQRVVLLTAGEGYVFQYNRDFYCLIDHDREISCIGLLYYGPTPFPVMRLDAVYRRKFELLLQVFLDEFDTRDNIQEEMLRMLLKRLIIICTRLFKEQSTLQYRADELDDIRKFHVLVELNFRQKQTVADYAEMMHKSPKTLSNLFARNQEPSPLKQIHNRITLEAKRLLTYTDKAIKEIGWELGFEEEAGFSRFFKRNTSFTPSDFRSSMKSIHP